MAAESEFQTESFSLDPILVKASSSFDSLSNDPFLPQQKIRFDQNRNTAQDVMDKSIPFPSQNYGYPSGSLGNNLGGRSVDDAQVSTLGVPLNLPQGGGPDLSIFPAFLWSGATFSMVPQLGGYSPQGVSGSIQLDLWTRNAVRDFKKSSRFNRITANVDRNLQTASVGSKIENSAILAGMSAGRQTGPSGSISLYAIKKPKSHLLFHLLGSEQSGDNPGSKSFPTPKAKKNFWRVIPVLESHQEYGNEDATVIWESTLSGDFQQLEYEDSDHPAFNTNTRTVQVGFENAIRFGASTIGFTARSVNFYSGTFGDHQDWPLIAQYSFDHEMNDEWKARWSGGGNFISQTGFVPLARLSLRQQNLKEESALFFEAHSLNKMPTMNDRYYQLVGFQGNPDLKPERVTALIAGMTHDFDHWSHTSTLKTEFRNQIQINSDLGAGNSTIVNQGNAWLISLQDELAWKPKSFLSQKLGTIITTSKVSNTNLPYPDLPTLSLLQNGNYDFNDDLSLRHTLRWIGPSKTGSGKDHPSYFLADLSASYEIKKDIVTTIGCDNVFDSRAEVILDYPLPGRIAYMNLQFSF
jgi:hypothetical protein